MQYLYQRRDCLQYTPEKQHNSIINNSPNLININLVHSASSPGCAILFIQKVWICIEKRGINEWTQIQKSVTN